MSFYIYKNFGPSSSYKRHFSVYINVLCSGLINVSCTLIIPRDADESDTDDTDGENSWGGLGSFEYSRKGIPHALMHGREVVECGGTHGATCSSVAEGGHRINLKTPAKLSRKCLSRNESQDHMLHYHQQEKLWNAVGVLDSKLNLTHTYSSPDESDVSDSTITTTSYVLREQLPYTNTWSDVRCVRGRTPVEWGRTFLSKHVLITRDELVSLLRVKLGLPATWSNTIDLVKKLRWRCFGSVRFLHDDKYRRTVVGFSSVSPRRRDFVRLRGVHNGTALSAQVTLIRTFDQYVLDMS